LGGKIFAPKAAKRIVVGVIFDVILKSKNMIKTHIKTAIFIFSAAFLAFTCLSVSAADDPTAGNYGLDQTVNVKSEAGFTAKQALLDPSQNKPDALVGRVIGTILSFVGVIFFVLIFYSGLKWMLAQGNESVIDSAKQTIIAATFGLIIVLAAYAITAFIGGQFTGTQ
jgi:cbb3-type cytochrome oxidase subunit 3